MKRYTQLSYDDQMTRGQDRVNADNALAGQLLELIQIVVKHLGARLEQLDLTTTDYFTLQALDGPMPMSELAESMNYDPSYVTALADRLSDLGLVDRQSVPTDRRVKNLVLTDKGRALKKSLPESLWKGSDVFSGLSDKERSELLALIGKTLP